MALNILISIIFIAICVLVYGWLDAKEKFVISKSTFYFLVALALGLRLWYGFGDYFFSYDINTFKAWSEYTVVHGLNGLYGQDYFLDYPPGFMYVLFFLRKIADLFSIATPSITYTFMMKLPAIIGDFACTALIYKATTENSSPTHGRFFALAYLFMPMVIFNSSIWGQIDSFYIFFVALSLYFAYKNKTIPAAISYAYAFLLKPQALLFGPVLLFYIIQRKSVKEFFKAVGTGILSLYILILPFCTNIFNLTWIYELYKDTFTGYKYFTVNAYNAHFLMGRNWQNLSASWQGNLINYWVIGFAIFAVGFIVLKSKEKGRFFTAAAFAIAVIFCFSTMMHERYLYPIAILCLLSAVLSNKKGMLYFGLLFSALNYLNTAFVMGEFIRDYQIPKWGANTLSFLMVLLTGALFVYLIGGLKKEGAFHYPKINTHWLLLGVITLGYTLVGFNALGSTKAPESYFQATEDNMSFDIVFDQPTEIKNIFAYSGLGDQELAPYGVKVGGEFDLLYTTDGNQFYSLQEIQPTTVFTWKHYPASTFASGVRIQAKNPGAVLYEIILTTAENQIIYGSLENYNPAAYYAASKAVDESHFLPLDTSYYYSMYFDEIYHGRTAYEQIHDASIYETTHPPLGKTLISGGIKIFGMNPFGWRVVGTLCGALLIPLMYLLIVAIGGNKKIGLIGAFLTAVDFMHLTQTRIATVDTYVVLFTLLTFLFMAYYFKQPFQSPKKEWLCLLLSGFFMGCTVAVKWNGAYAMIGLAIFFFIALFVKYKQSPQKISQKHYVVQTILWCFLAFLAVPIAVYILSYVPIIHSNSMGDFLSQVWRCQLSMYDYHANLEAEHFFASLWYTWPFNIKPIWYSVSYLASGAISTISAFGNPIIWALTPFAAAYCGYIGIRKKNPLYGFVFLGYLSSYLPWMFITRLSFIYHYFPSALFGIIAISICIKELLEKKPNWKKWVVVYLGFALLLFMVFLPVLTGAPAPKWYIDMLELLPSWYFVN